MQQDMKENVGEKAAKSIISVLVFAEVQTQKKEILEPVLHLALRNTPEKPGIVTCKPFQTLPLSHLR